MWRASVLSSRGVESGLDRWTSHLAPAPLKEMQMTSSDSDGLGTKPVVRDGLSRLKRFLTSPKVLPIAAAAAALAVGLVVGILAFQEPEPYAPLYGYDEQAVLNPNISAEGLPTVRPLEGERLVVAARKCSTETTDVRGTVSWQRVDPPGSSDVFVGEGATIREIGCTYNQPEDFNAPWPVEPAGTVNPPFENDVPERVIALTEQFGSATWRIVGQETPIHNDGEEGTPVSWQTEDFVVIAEGTS